MSVSLDFFKFSLFKSENARFFFLDESLKTKNKIMTSSIIDNQNQKLFGEGTPLDNAETAVVSVFICNKIYFIIF